MFHPRSGRFIYFIHTTQSSINQHNSIKVTFSPIQMENAVSIKRHRASHGTRRNKSPIAESNRDISLRIQDIQIQAKALNKALREPPSILLSSQSIKAMQLNPSVLPTPQPLSCHLPCSNTEGKDREQTKSITTKSSGCDERTVPSIASGGIAEPSAEYIAASLIPAQYLQKRQHLLVVIDLNGTILYRPEKHRPTHAVARPGTREFVEYCLNKFIVVVWSSATPANVKQMCKLLGQDVATRAVAVWGRDRFGLTSGDYVKRVICYKRLTSLWKDQVIAKSHPEYHRGCRWDQTNTILIDESPEKARSEPYNLIAIPEFTGSSQEQGDVLASVQNFLDDLSMISNISSFCRHQPFEPNRQNSRPEHANPTIRRTGIDPPSINAPSKP